LGEATSSPPWTRQPDRRDARGRPHLTDANLLRANLSGADLSGAYMTGAHLVVADLTGANLNGARLTGAYPFRAILTHARLFGALGVAQKYLEAAYGEKVVLPKDPPDLTLKPCREP